MLSRLTRYFGLFAVLQCSSSNATPVSVAEAKEGYFHCLEYNALRADNGSDPIDLIINTVKEKCQIERVILGGILKMEMKESNAFKPDELRVVQQTIIERFDREISNHINSILMQIRNIRENSKNAPNH